MANPAYQQVAKVIAGQAGNLSGAERKALKGLLDGFDDQPQIPFPSYKVNVDYAQSVEQLIKAGKYDWFNKDVSDSHFPLNKKGEEPTEIYLVTIDRRRSNAEIDQILDKWGLQDANVKELLTLGATHKDLQREGLIVARGSTWRDSYGGVRVPYLDGNEGGRYLYLAWWRGAWDSDWRFAAVRK